MTESEKYLPDRIWKWLKNIIYQVTLPMRIITCPNYITYKGEYKMPWNTTKWRKQFNEEINSEVNRRYI